MRIRNFTPHFVCVFLPDGTERRIPIEGIIRLTTHTYERSPVDGIPVVNITRGGLTGVPEDLEPDDYMIVSDMVREYVAANRTLYPNWHRFLSPNTSPGSVVRGTDGSILGVKGLVTSL